MLLARLLPAVLVAAWLLPTGRADASPELLAQAKTLLASDERKDRLKGLQFIEDVGRKTAAEKLALDALDDPDWSVQIRCAGVLAKVGGEASLKDLAELAVHGEIHLVRVAATRALAGLDPQGAAPRILGFAKRAKKPVVRARAVDMAATCIRPEHLSDLKPSIKHKKVEVAAAGHRAAGRLLAHDETRDDVRKLLVKALRQREKKKFFLSYLAAVEALGDEGSTESLATLVQELTLQPDDDPYVPERIARKLEAADRKLVVSAVRSGFGYAGKPPPLRRLTRLAARLRLHEARDEVTTLLAHKDHRVRSESVRALGRMGDEKAVPDVEKALDDASPFVRIEAVAALGRLVSANRFRGYTGRILEDKTTEVRLQYVVETERYGDPEGIGKLAPRFTQDKSWRVASAAAATIGTLGIASDLPHLTPLVASKNWRIRGAAYEAMGRLRAADAIPLLADGLEDKDPLVVGVCHTNLQILSSEQFDPRPEIWHRWYKNNRKTLNLVKRSRRSAEEKAADAKRKQAQERYSRQTGVEILQKARILVISGAWDKVQLVLNHLSIPHSLLRAQEIKDAGLNPNQIVLINCEGNVDEDSRERLRWFVNVGGYVLSTDWVLTKAIRDCWPGYVEQFSGSSTGNDVVVVQEADPGHPFTSGIFDDVPALKWWLEVQAFPMTITYPERCDVLVDSAVMRQRYGSSPMAVTFRWGLGKVTHALSHFYLQEEGMQHARDARDRMIFAADNLGLSLEQIRRLAKEDRWAGRLNEETMKQIAPDYSMFRMIVNVVAEKANWVENL